MKLLLVARAAGLLLWLALLILRGVIVRFERFRWPRFCFSFPLRNLIAGRIVQILPRRLADRNFPTRYLANAVC